MFLSRKYPSLSLKPEKYQKLCNVVLEGEEKTIYMGQNRASTLKRTGGRLSVPPRNLPLSNWEQPRVPYPLVSDEVRLSVQEACNQRTCLSSRHCVRLSVQHVA